MTPPLFLVDQLPAGEMLHLGGDEGRHAARVRRLGVGEDVLVSDGAGTVLDATVVAVVPDGLRLQVTERRVVERPDPRLVVVQALPKGDRAELAVELLTELGADEIVPWAAERSIVQWSGTRGERAAEKWRRTAREAAKQSRRAWVPGIAPLASTADVSARLSRSTGFVLHTDAGLALADAGLPAHGDIAIVVGPEGGITGPELSAFVGTGAAAVRLGDGVLRTSTAGAAAVSALSVRLGRWN